MRLDTTLWVATAVCLLFATGAAPGTMSSMRWHRRIVLVAASSAAAPEAILQRRILDDWSREAADRDITLVQIDGARVMGASDAAASLRRRYRLSPGAFQLLLIGKDGHVALRSMRPVDAATLEAAIDAMPMRRAGKR